MAAIEHIETPLDVEAIKKDFPILEREVHGKRLVYLDSAASSQKPVQVLDAMDRFQRCSYANVHRGVYQIATSGSNGIYRLWAAQTAPPAAQAKLLVVNDGQIALGQCCHDGCGGCCGSGWGLLGNPWVLGGIVAAAIAIPLALDEAS